MVDEKQILKILDDHTKRLERIEKLLENITQPSTFSIPKTRSKTSKLTTRSLLLLFKSEKFFDQPRTLSEIAKKFEEESRSIKPSGLTMPLQRLVRSRDLGRVLKNGRWAYVKR